MNNHIKAGLVYAGKNDEGEKEYIGTQQQWNKLEEYQEQDEREYYDEQLDLKIDSFRQGETNRY